MYIFVKHFFFGFSFSIYLYVVYNIYQNRKIPIFQYPKHFTFTHAYIYKIQTVFFPSAKSLCINANALWRIHLFHGEKK